MTDRGVLAMDHEGAPAMALLQALAAASAPIASEPYTTDIGAIVVEQAAQMLAAVDARLVLLDTDPRWLVLHQAVGVAAPRVGARQPSTAGVLGQVVQSGE